MSNIPRILLVDDEPGTSELVSRILVKQGYEVVVMESGEDALKLLNRDAHFDLILLDYLMIGVDGLETLEVIKKQPHTQHLKVIIQSGSADVNDMEKARSLGAAGYILKPIKVSELLEQVKKQLAL